MSVTTAVGGGDRAEEESWLPPWLARQQAVGRWPYVVLLASVVLYAVVALYLSRGSSFTFDELRWYTDATAGFDLDAIFAPYNGHLIATTRVVTTGVLEVLGPDHAAITVFIVLAVSATAVALYAFLWPRVGRVAALFPCILILFMGSTPVALSPNVSVFAQSAATGIGALVLLERDRFRWDLLACLLLLLGAASFSLGLTFICGAGAFLLSGPRTTRRLWVAVVPGALYVLWYLWAPPEGSTVLTPANILLLPNYGADSLAGASAVLTGMSHQFYGDFTSRVPIGIGQVIAAVLIAVIVRRVWTDHGFSRSALAVVVVAVGFWAIGSVSSGYLRTPSDDRYVFPVAVLLVMMLAEVHRYVVIGRRGLLTLGLLLALALPANLWDMRFDGADIRANSDRIRAQIAMVELQRNNVSPNLKDVLGLLESNTVGELMSAADTFGSIAMPLDELTGQTETVREQADSSLARLVELELVRMDPPVDRRDCRDGQTTIDVDAGSTLSMKGHEGGDVTLSRFADAAGFGPLAVPKEQWVSLQLPPDISTVPWTVNLPPGVKVCQG